MTDSLGFHAPSAHRRSGQLKHRFERAKESGPRSAAFNRPYPHVIVTVQLPVIVQLKAIKP